MTLNTTPEQGTHQDPIERPIIGTPAMEPEEDVQGPPLPAIVEPNDAASRHGPTASK
jgi:hypothetical protein